jgi:hypothetical protein
MELALLAAQEWARLNAPVFSDPVEFGNKVAQVYCACEKTQYHAGDARATAAALAALSVRPEVLQLISQLALLDLPHSVQPIQKDLAGAE